MTVRVGVIGVGVMGADHAQNLHHHISGAEVTAISDYNDDTARTVAATLPNVEVIADGLSLVGSDAVDAVVIASQDSTHAALVLAALDAGKPVLCEKPLAPTAAEARHVVETEQKTGRSRIGLGFMRRFDPAYVDLKDVVTSGGIGDIVLAHCVSRTVEAYPGGDSASTITNAAIHELDIVPWLLDSPIAEVSWHAGRRSRHAGKRQDPQLMLLRTDSQVMITVEVFLNARYGYDTRCEIVGETGAATLNAAARVIVDRDRSRSTSYPPDWVPRYADAYRLELQEWIDAIAADRPSRLATATDGWNAAIVADALIESMNSGGRPIPVHYS